MMNTTNRKYRISMLNVLLPREGDRVV